VREERSSHSGLPLAAGKLIYGRGYRNRTSARGHLRIRYTLRPHVIIRLLDHLVLTLMDTGSEISIINAETAERARNMQIRRGREDPPSRRNQSQAAILPPNHRTGENAEAYV